MSEADDDFADLSSPRKRRTRSGQADFPVFVMIVMILEFLFAIIRGFACLANAAVVVMAGTNPQLAPLQVPAGVSAIVDGLLVLVMVVAAIGILMRSGWGLTCGWLAAGVTVLSIPVTAWGAYAALPLQWANLPPGQGDAVRIGQMIGLVIGVGVRVVWLIVYFVALQQYAKWLQGSANAASDE